MVSTYDTLLLGPGPGPNLLVVSDQHPTFQQQFNKKKREKHLLIHKLITNILLVKYLFTKTLI